MLINNGALLICSRRKRRREMPHTSLTYFYWHARLHGRHGKVFSEKTGTLPLFAFVSSSHWAVILSHMSECRLDRWYMLILLCEEMQNCFVSMRIVYASQYLLLSCFQYHLHAEMMLRLYVWHGTHNGVILLSLLLLTPEYESRVYIQRHIYNITAPLWMSSDELFHVHFSKEYFSNSGMSPIRSVLQGP